MSLIACAQRVLEEYPNRLSVHDTGAEDVDKEGAHEDKEINKATDLAKETEVISDLPGVNRGILLHSKIH